MIDYEMMLKELIEERECIDNLIKAAMHLQDLRKSDGSKKSVKKVEKTKKVTVDS